MPIYYITGTTLLPSYYTTGETLTLIAAVHTGATLLSQLHDVTVGSPSNQLITGQTLTWYAGYWINSATTINLSLYYTSSQVDTKFYTSAQTIALFSSTGHSHYLTGLTDLAHWTPSHGQFLMYSARTWVPTASAMGGSYINKSGDTMTGSLIFNFMSGSTIPETTGWTLYVDTTGKVIRGTSLISGFITSNQFITLMNTETNWSGRTFTNIAISAYTLYSGQTYEDINYSYKYYGGKLYRSYYSLQDHNHDTRYYTKTELLNGGVLDGRYIRSAITYNLIGLGDVNINTGTLTGISLLKYDGTSKWRNYELDLTIYSKVANSVSTGRTVLGVSGLTGGNNLNNNVYIMHLTGTPMGTTVSASDGIVMASIGSFDVFGHILTYSYKDLDTRYLQIGAMALDDLSDVVAPTPSNKDVLMYSSIMGGYWYNKRLAMADISDFSDSNYVHKTGDESIAGTKTFTGSVAFNSKITITASTTLTAPKLNVNDRVLYINYQTVKGSGLGANGKAGISIERGNYLSYTLYCDEGATNTTTGCSLRVGVGFTGKTVATIDQFNHYGINIWDNRYRYLTNCTAFTYNSVLNSINIGPNITPATSNSFIIGSGNTVSSDYTFVFGLYNAGSGVYSVSLGDLNNVAFESIAQGTRNYVGGSYSGAFGIDHILDQNVSMIGYSYAFGSGHTMNGNTLGETPLYGQYCGAFGERNTVTGNWAFATGKLNIVQSSATYSAIVGGSGITAKEKETLYTRNFSHTGTRIGFFNSVLVPKVAALTSSLTQTTGTTEGGETFKWTATSALSNCIGFADNNQFNGMTIVVENLQIRLNQLETYLKSYGLLP